MGDRRFRISPSAPPPSPMPKQWLLFSSRRRLLLRSPLFLGSLALAACRRPLGPANAPAGAKAVTPVADATHSARPSSPELALTPACGDSPITPAQTPGPFYRPNSPQRQSLLEADTPGTRLILSGQVLAPNCQPLSNCLVDFWQADAQGNYDNQGDLLRQAPKNRLRGHQFTDGEGRYRLETIVPGIYPGRTRHLHVLVQPANGGMLTTQLYLANEPLNQRDGLYRPELMMTIQATQGEPQAPVIQAQFNFVVEAPGEQPAREEPREAGADLWAQLQQPQSAYFLLMRHALAPGSGDPANFRLGDCSTQRNLSAEGREQARRTGEAFRRRGIAVRRVLSSQWCRCLETAELMGLGAVQPFAPLNSFFRDRATEASQTAAVRQSLQDNGQRPGVTLLVTHFVNIAALAGRGPASGEIIAMRLGEENRLEVVGAIAPF